jgi:hypothetical protein
MKPGDKVAYSVGFLKSIFEPPTSPMCHARGTITGILDLGSTKIASVDWGTDEFPKKANIANLAIVGPNSKFCQC